MGLYQRHVLPRLLHKAMGLRSLRPLREAVTSHARGRVLEVGIGSGLNFPFYRSEVTALCGLDPSAALLEIAARSAAAAAFEVELVNQGAERMPFADRSFDSVVTAWTLCSVGEPTAVLSEMRRVLRDDGTLLFVEHGLSAERGVQTWQHRLTPLWRRVAGGCHLDREIDALIRAAGFAIGALETGYLIKGPRPATYHYQGQARPS